MSKVGLPNHGWLVWHHPLRRHRETAEQLHQAVAVDGEVYGLAHANVVERRGRKGAELIGPDMRVNVGDDVHAGRLELRHCIGRRRFDPVDLAGEQRRDARGRVGHREQHQALTFRYTRGIPVVRVTMQQRPIPRGEAVEDPRSGAGRRLRELIPIAAQFLPTRRAGYVDVRHLVGEYRIRLVGRDLHRRRVERTIGGDRADIGRALRRLRLVVLRCIPLDEFVEVPHHRVGVECAAVVELDPGAEFERPDGPGRGIDLPTQRQARQRAVRRCLPATGRS